MTRNILKSTTAITLCLSLAVPAPLLAESHATAETETTTTTEMTTSTTEATEVELTEEELRKRLEEEAAAAAAAAEASSDTSADSSATTESTSTDSTATADTNADAPMSTETTTSETPVTTESGASTDSSTETMTTTETPDETATDGTSMETTTTDGATTNDAEVTAETETSTETSGDAATTDMADVEPMTAQEQADMTAEAFQSDAPAAAAEADSTAEAEVTTETVTEDTSRSSTEDFKTEVTGDASVTAETKAKKDGLSNFEKAALLGLGALAVGTILNSGSKVVSNSGDRVVVQQDGQLRVLKDDDVLLRQPGSEVRTETFSDGSTRTTVSRDDGLQVVTIRNADGQVLRRTRILPDGTEVMLFDDTRQFERVTVSELTPAQRGVVQYSGVSEADLQQALVSTRGQDAGRTFSLSQIRNIDAVRELVPEIAVDNVNFETGSAAIRPDEAQELAMLGNAMRRAIQENPGEVFLIEGHTDAVGDATYNLSLSDRRAETVALALTEYFDVPPENMIVQGYGESHLKVQTTEGNRENRRAAVRNITPLLR